MSKPDKYAEPYTWLDPAPFVAFIDKRIKECKCELNPCCYAHLEDNKALSAAGLACARLGINARSLYGWRSGERTHVHIDTVERAIINDGRLRLADVYPQFEEERTVA